MSDGKIAYALSSLSTIYGAPPCSGHRISHDVIVEEDLPVYRAALTLDFNISTSFKMPTKDQGIIMIGQYLLARLEQLHVKVCHMLPVCIIARTSIESLCLVYSQCSESRGTLILDFW